MSFPFNPLRISVDKSASRLYGALTFKTRKIEIGKVPKVYSVYLYGPKSIGKSYEVIYFDGDKARKWSTDNFETAWRAAWRRLMRED
jgi:hypothetical protein